MSLRTSLRTIATVLSGSLALSATSVAMAEPATHAHAGQQVTEQQFTATFAAFGELPAAAVPARAVDLDSFEPPVETAPAASPLGSGIVSYYGAKFHGRRTASGATFDMHAMTAAHRTLPFGSRVLVTNPANGRSVTVTINDRGPFHGGRVIDVSRAAATELGLIQRGHGTVELALLD